MQETICMQVTGQHNNNDKVLSSDSRAERLQEKSCQAIEFTTEWLLHKNHTTEDYSAETLVFFKDQVLCVWVISWRLRYKGWKGSRVLAPVSYIIIIILWQWTLDYLDTSGQADSPPPQYWI